MLVVLAIALAALVPLDHADSPTRIAGQYIVRYHPTVTEGLIDYHLRDLEARPTHRYHNVYRGFAAKLTDQQLLRVRQHPFVAGLLFFPPIFSFIRRSLTCSALSLTQSFSR
jgi:hypothetical protein